MPEPVSLLMLQFLDWVSSRRRTYNDVMEAWQTTCPRHTVWEDAVIEGLVQVNGAGKMNQSEVTLTARGRSILEENHSHKSPPG